MKLTSRADVRAFVAVFFALSWVLYLAPGHALAVTCAVDGSGKGKSSPASVDQQWGNKANRILVVDPDSACPLVRSLYIGGSDSDNWVEVGWFKDGTDGGIDKCSNTTNPHVLVWATVNGFNKCKTGTPALTAGEEYSFRADNPDHDSDFVYYWDSDTSPDISLGFFSVDQTHGRPYSGDERHYAGESLRGHFVGLASLAGGGSWQDYPSSYDYSSPGTADYVFCSSTSSSFDVKLSGSC